MGKVHDLTGVQILNYDKNTIYVTGLAKTSKTDPISDIFSTFFVGVMVNSTDNKIIDFTCNTVSQKTSSFIESIIVGYNLLEDMDEIVSQIERRFLGTAQKALIVALKDAQNKYKMFKESGISS
ncbi:MAG: hypothetical protein PWR06_2912 [Thermoanaerobacteraceae bacterium]|jgi:hypothetical protein|uniref:DUF3870 domain-containing protein n=1 Tax=Biomaibacter acetigenes TaxID=2316383 RepID=A0A3G2R738_9FIRM|nr:DUF3870 domain-containing protein [Biomaibacter acetigenes]MDK2880196.1 hypothetical protein [Thermoanaerobacteraceae bacterium]MDN5312674.1 hypothetical protein [Thermoanaerobacteraceae bacterium]RKL64068.1 DUF3870 domain-containing protein [Thermoanaerobacteraceae bacterium SP2]